MSRLTTILLLICIFGAWCVLSNCDYNDAVKAAEKSKPIAKIKTCDENCKLILIQEHFEQELGK